MDKCNWCGKRTKVNFKSKVQGRDYHSFCTPKCVLAYEGALKLGRIPRKPIKPMSVVKAIVYVSLVLFVLSEWM